MSASKDQEKDHAPEGDKSLGLRMTEKLLPIFGPPAVGDSTKPARKTTQAEENRDHELENELVRKKGADGATYLEARGAADSINED